MAALAFNKFICFLFVINDHLNLSHKQLYINLIKKSCPCEFCKIFPNSHATSQQMEMTGEAKTCSTRTLNTLVKRLTTETLSLRTLSKSLSSPKDLPA